MILNAYTEAQRVEDRHVGPQSHSWGGVGSYFSFVLLKTAFPCEK
jgi:hypothetical protein